MVQTKNSLQKRNPVSEKMFLTAVRHGQKRTFRCGSNVSSVVVEYLVDGMKADDDVFCLYEILILI